MPLLQASDFDTANVIANIALAGSAVLLVSITVYGWRKITSFFSRG